MSRPRLGRHLFTMITSPGELQIWVDKFPMIVSVKNGTDFPVEIVVRKIRKARKPKISDTECK